MNKEMKINEKLASSNKEFAIPWISVSFVIFCAIEGLRNSMPLRRKATPAMHVKVEYLNTFLA